MLDLEHFLAHSTNHEECGGYISISKDEQELYFLPMEWIEDKTTS